MPLSTGHKRLTEEQQERARELRRERRSQRQEGFEDEPVRTSTRPLPPPSLTLVSPLDVRGELEDPNWIPYLTVRLEADPKDRAASEQARSVLRSVVMVIGPPELPPGASPYSEDDLAILLEEGSYELDEAATGAAVISAFTQAGFTVLSLDIAGGLRWMKLPQVTNY